MGLEYDSVFGCPNRSRDFWGCADTAVASAKAFLPLQGMTLIPHVNSRAPFDFAKISALRQVITDDIVCDTL